MEEVHHQATRAAAVAALSMVQAAASAAAASLTRRMADARGRTQRATAFARLWNIATVRSRQVPSVYQVRCIILWKRPPSRGCGTPQWQEIIKHQVHSTIQSPSVRVCVFFVFFMADRRMGIIVSCFSQLVLVPHPPSVLSCLLQP